MACSYARKHIRIFERERKRTPDKKISNMAEEAAAKAGRFDEKTTCPGGAQKTDELLKAFQAKNVLFYIERNQNSNAVIYEANVGADGKLDQKEPVKVYWIMYEHKPVDEEGLNMIERNSAYGMSTKPIKGKDGHHDLVVIPLKKKKTLEVWQDDDGTLHCQTEIGGDTAEIRSVYVESKKNWVGLPKVQYVDSRVPRDGSAAYEKMKP